MDHNVFDDPRITAVGLLYEAHAGLSARFAAQFEEHGLSPVEFEVLTRLARSPNNQLRMTDLAAQTSLSTSGVTRVVDRMERDGLIRRRACPTDRRSSFAVVTAAGLRSAGRDPPRPPENHRAVVHRPARSGRAGRAPGRAAPGSGRGPPGCHRRQHGAAGSTTPGRTHRLPTGHRQKDRQNHPHARANAHKTDYPAG